MFYFKLVLGNILLFCYFVRSGDINLNSGYVRNVGLHGFWWASHTNSSDTNAHRLYINASIVGQFGANSRWDAFPLRCLSTV